MAVLGALWLWGRAVRAARRERRGAIASAARLTATAAAAGYLWFVALWGLNYARPALDARMGLPLAPASAEEIAGLLTRAIDEVNALYGLRTRRSGLCAIRRRTRRRACRARRRGPSGPVACDGPGSPKPTLLAPYLRMAGVDGLTAPAALETLLNPDLTDAERPFALAHEWAHLRLRPGGRRELRGVAGDDGGARAPQTRYSGWLFLVMETAAQVPRDRVGPRSTGWARDHGATWPPSPRARGNAWTSCSASAGASTTRYLRSQGVREGVVSYSRVVDLIARASRS